MKYKVGDKVRIKTWKQLVMEFELDYDHIDVPNCEFNELMEEQLNKLNCDRNLTIKEILSNTYHDYYKMEGISWAWNDEMIECLVENCAIPIKNRWELLDL